MDGGFFGGLFDLNRDGKLDTFERTLDIMAFDELMRETKKAEREAEGLYFDDDNDEFFSY